MKDPQKSFKNGIYIMARPFKDDYYPHYIGMTERDFAKRINEHMRSYLSGRYYNCSSNCLKGI